MSILKSCRNRLATSPRTLSLLRRSGLLRWAPHSVSRRLAVAHPFEVELPDGATITWVPSISDGIARKLFWHGAAAYEPETAAVVFRLARRLRSFIDVGAFTGYFTVMIAGLNKSCDLRAFEPTPRTFAHLVQNIEANGLTNRCLATNAAVSSKSGRTTFHIPNADLPSSASLNPTGFRSLPGETIDVACVTLDQSLRDLAHCDLIKIDTEGFEFDVLVGAESTIRAHAPDLLIECIAETDVTSINKFLLELGYTAFHLASQGPVRVESVTPDTAGDDRNFLFTKRTETLHTLQSWATQ